jgi:hypothetical protein
VKGFAIQNGRKGKRENITFPNAFHKKQSEFDAQLREMQKPKPGIRD